MEPEIQPAGPNIAVLHQGADLLRRLDGRQYDESIGMQFRHCLDFYFCLLAGLPGGEVDYERRSRDDRIAEDREYALSAFDSLIRDLERVDPEWTARRIRVRGEAPAGDPHEAGRWSESSGLRELQFLFSHTIHHYAIIRLLLKAAGFETSPEFGVAPSTLRYWERHTGRPAG